jgi:hypothetical protein
MTDYLDSDTIATVATVSATETYQSVDSATINPKTTVTSVDAFAAVNTLTVSGKTTVSAAEQMTGAPVEYVDTVTASYTGLAVGDTVTFTVTASMVTSTVGTTTTVDSIITYAVSIHTTDYDGATLVGYSSYDSSYVVAGDVGQHDDDDGVLPIAGPQPI